MAVMVIVVLGVIDAVGETDDVEEPVLVGELVALLVEVADFVGVLVDVAVAVPVCVAEAVVVVLLVLEGVDVAVVVGDAELLGGGVAVGDRDVVELRDEVDVGVVVPVGVCVGDGDGRTPLSVTVAGPAVSWPSVT